MIVRWNLDKLHLSLFVLWNIKIIYLLYHINHVILAIHSDSQGNTIWNELTFHYGPSEFYSNWTWFVVTFLPTFERKEMEGHFSHNQMDIWRPSEYLLSYLSHFAFSDLSYEWKCKKRKEKEDWIRDVDCNEPSLIHLSPAEIKDQLLHWNKLIMNIYTRVRYGNNRCVRPFLSLKIG